ncbi:hypothetical protein DICA0_B00452 [Diutina catenulata]
MSGHYPTLPRSSGLGSVFKSFTKSLKSSSKASVTAVSINPTMVGGEDLMKLLAQLGKEGNSVATRASAASRIGELISQYSMASIPEIWYTARDLLDPGQTSAIRRPAIRLLRGCIASGGTLVSSRIVYYKDILHYCRLNDPDYDLFLKALSKLTEDGANMGDVLGYDAKAFVQFVASHIGELPGSTIEFLGGCLRQQPMDEKSVSSLTRAIIDIAVASTDSELVLTAYRALCASIEFQPYGIELRTMEYLSAIYALDPDQFDFFDALMANSGDPVHKTTMSVLSSILGNSELAQSRHVQFPINRQTLKLHPLALALYSALGTIAIVTRMVVAGCDCVPEMAQAFTECVRRNVSMVNTQVLRWLDRLFTPENYEENFGANPGFSTVMPFNVWYTSTTLFDVMMAIPIISDSDTSYMQAILSSIHQLWDTHELECRHESVVELFLHYKKLLPVDGATYILRYYNDHQLCTVLSPLWKDNCRTIVNTFYYNNKVQQVRLECLRVIHEAYKTSIAVYARDRLDYDIMFDLFPRSKHETDGVVLDYLLNTMFTFIALRYPDAVYFKLCDLFISDIGAYKASVTGAANASAIASLRSIGSRSSNHTEPSVNFSDDFLVKMATSFGRIFCIALSKASAKAIKTFTVMQQFLALGLAVGHVGAILASAKVFIRIRITTGGYVFLTEPGDMVGLSTTFKRNTEDDGFVKKDHYQWVYPDHPTYLPDDYMDKPSKVKIGKSPDQLSMGPWFNVVVDIMQNFYDWEVYSFIWGHFCSQLANLELFWNHPTVVISLKSIICGQLTTSLPPAVRIPADEISKADLQVALIRTMSALLGYHPLMVRKDHDDLVTALLLGLGWWERTAVPCINLMAVCCHELPASVARVVPVLLTKLQTRVTSAEASTHTLELLSALVKTAEVAANLTVDDYKRVYGIAFKYIQCAQDMKATKPTPKPSVAEHGVDAQPDRTLGRTEAVPWQYVLTMSYRVICDWFLTMDRAKRPQVSDYLVKNIVAGTADDNTTGLVDFVSQFTYSDAPLSIYHPSSKNSKRWMVGNTLISMDTQGSGSRWIIMRPSAVTVLDVTPHPAGTAPELTSNYYFLQLFNSPAIEKPLAISDNDTVAGRAVMLLEKIPTVEFHKIGIIYHGPGQLTEEEVLSNSCGSKRYHRFLVAMGPLYKLSTKPPAIYVGGLDIDSGADGEFTRYWRDRTVQIVYHVTTMMFPPAISRKKHIGNNYVNIYWDESGLPFNFNLIKSQFTFLSIVVSPHTRQDTGYRGYCTSANAESDQRDTNTRGDATKFYRVKVYRRAGVPQLFAASHFKMISEANLPGFVRTLAIMADHFAHVWHNPNHPFQIWSQRARALREIREKLNDRRKGEAASNVDPSSAHAETEFNSFMDPVKSI